MSSTNRGRTRNLDDHYATPPDACRLGIAHLADDYFNHDPPVNVMVPGCGEGNWLHAAQSRWSDAVCEGFDINPVLVTAAKERGLSATEVDLFHHDAPDYHLVVTNPPFKHAQAFIRWGMVHLDPDYGAMAFLLRLNYLGGKRRYLELWEDHPPSHIYVYPLRLGFTPDGRADSIEYGLFVWTAYEDGATTLSWIDNTDCDNKWRGVDLEQRVDLEASTEGDVRTHKQTAEAETWL